ncbi:MAG: citrate lyase acyl carrier protein [Clostridia bacterium]|nr:citrate lyase acyl carrier protein [Clostridia bacterium]
MQIVALGVAGTMESSDIIVRIEPNDGGGIELSIESTVMQQYGKQIDRVIRKTLSDLGVESATVAVVDKGALDCTIAARVSCAAFRAAQSTDYVWNGGVKQCQAD